jgi:hypothetical protein
MSDNFTPQQKAVAVKVGASNGLPANTNPRSAHDHLTGDEWAKYYYPHLFTRPFAFYQTDFWHWIDEIEPDKYYRPRIECEPRGVGKSTNAEAAVVKLVAQKKRCMVGYVSLNEEKAGKHFNSIKSMLESDRLLKDYPHCKPKVQKLRDTAESWSRDAIVTESEAMVVPLTLLGSSRGWKSASGKRFDFIVLDDIDALGQSADFTKKLIELLKGEILAAGDDNTVVLMPQNLIYRDSICAQILDHRADILSDRIFCGAYPLLKWYDAEKIDLEDGAKKWVITAGEPFDNAVPVAYAEKLLNKFGKATFDRECQQEVWKVEDDKDFREWNEQMHLITVSEFRRVMESYNEPVWNHSRECLQIPQRWNVGIGMDWGTTREHPTGVAFVARPSQMSPFKDCHFVFGEVVLPKFPLDSFETPEMVSPGRVATAIDSFLKQWNVSESMVEMRLMSHEASAALATMAIDLKDDVKQFFAKWKAKKGSGVPQIQNLLEIDKKKPQPFRRNPKTNEQLQGRPRIYFIVEDRQGALGIDASGKVYVSGATDSKGLARARFEMPLYSHRNTGKEKIDDDWVDGFRGLMNLFGVDSDPKTEEEEIEDRKSDTLKQVNQPKVMSSGRQAAIAEETARIKREMEREDVVYVDMFSQGGY